MERIKYLNKSEKAVFFVTLTLSIIFLALYCVIVPRTGYQYHNTIFVTENNWDDDTAQYTGILNFKKAKFIVENHSKVTFIYGDESYGPYTVNRDSTAIPDGDESTGMVVKKGDEILFRGGVSPWLNRAIMKDENGSYINIEDAISNDSRPYTSIEPSAEDLIVLTHYYYPTNFGNATMGIIGILICVLIMLSVLFVDEIFNIYLLTFGKKAHKTEPESFDYFLRYFLWIVFLIIAMVILILGLR